MSSLLSAARQAEPQGISKAAPAHVVSAVKSASAKTGVDFSYLMEKAAVESGYRTDVKANTSSATGLFQFIERTWLDMVETHGAKHGLAKQAAAIDRDASGAPFVSDPAVKRQILDMRKDPRISALMAGELVKENQQRLEDELNRPVGKTELYMAHFLGAGGAAKFLKAMDQNPDRNAASLLPDAARANRNVFFDKGGRACTLCEVFDRFARKFGDDPVSDGSRLGKVQTEVAEHQPWHATRSVASAHEPLSTFTAMVLSQLAPPLEKERQKEAQGDAEKDKLTPNLAAGPAGV